MNLFPSDQQLRKISELLGKKKEDLRTVHVYSNEVGEPLFFKLRYEFDSIKTIRPVFFIENELVLGEPKFEGGKPIYAQKALHENPNQIVVIVEGEKAADALLSVGILATTSGGATSAERADWTPLKGRTVIIWPDNDQPGLAYAKEVEIKLQSIASSTIIIDPATLQLGKSQDAFDWLKEHGAISYSQIFCFSRLATPELKASKSQDSTLSTVDIKEFLCRELPPRRMLLSPILQEQSINQLYGWRGSGKTFVALEIAWAVATGSSAFGWSAPARQKVLYLDGEMPAAEIQNRLRILEKSTACSPEPGFFRLLTPDLQEGRLPDLSDRTAQGEIDALVDDASLIVIDNISAWVRGAAGRENDGESWVPVGEWALEWRRKGKALLFIHHSGKGGEQRGTSRREDILDIVIALRQPNDYEPSQGCRVEFKFEKSRHIAGDALTQFIAQLHVDDAGTRHWELTDSKNSQQTQVLELLKTGLSQSEIARELKVNRSTICRHEQKFRAAGAL